MDFDDLEAPSKVPSRPTRFAPTSKLKPKPKLEPPQPPPKPEAEPQPSISKPEPQEFVITAKQKEDVEDTLGAAAPSTHSKAEPNGTIKSETEEDESRQDDPMDEDTEVDALVREIDVFFSPSIDADSQVRLKPGTSEIEFDLSVDLGSDSIDKDFAVELKYTKQVSS